MPRLSTGGDTVHETHRVAFNEWICVSDEVGGFVDFCLALRDPDIPTQMLPIYDCGDGRHRNRRSATSGWGCRDRAALNRNPRNRLPRRSHISIR